MERYDCTLWDCLKDVTNFKISATEKVRFFASIVEVVIYIQSKGVCHRDIKPSNFLVRTKELSTSNTCYKLVENEWKLSDFGLSCNTSNLSGTGGTPCFGPMEQFDGNSHQKSDNYSLAKLGILLIFSWQIGWNLLAAPLSPSEYNKYSNYYLDIFRELTHVSISEINWSQL